MVVRRHPATLPPPIGVLAEVRTRAIVSCERDDSRLLKSSNVLAAAWARLPMSSTRASSQPRKQLRSCGAIRSIESAGPTLAISTIEGRRRSRRSDVRWWANDDRHDVVARLGCRETRHVPAVAGRVHDHIDRQKRAGRSGVGASPFLVPLVPSSSFGVEVVFFQHVAVAPTWFLRSDCADLDGSSDERLRVSEPAAAGSRLRRPE